MKKFSEYLAEQIRNYEYQVKLSFLPDNEMMTAIENALQKYNLISITKPKSLPIQRIDKSFPGMKSPETYVFTVEIAYGAPAEFIRHTIASVGFAFETVSVASTSLVPGITTDHVTSVEKEEDGIDANTRRHPLLTKDYEPQNNEEISGENFGDTYNEKLVKNSIGSTDQVIPAEFKKTRGKTLNDPEFKVGKDSAVGSKKIQKPVIKSFAR